MKKFWNQISNLFLNQVQFFFYHHWHHILCLQVHQKMIDLIELIMKCDDFNGLNQIPRMQNDYKKDNNFVMFNFHC